MQQQPEQQTDQQQPSTDQTPEQQPEQQAGQQAEQDEQQPLSDETIEQWLNKVPDDPGGLLRKKFKYLYKKRQQIDDLNRDG